MAINGIKASVRVATAGFSTTVVGFIAGVVLLFSHPLLSECVILTSYLAAVIAVYAFGFGWGVIANARLLRTS
jgi:hypothetical protein